jgi:hypothetical protein
MGARVLDGKSLRDQILSELRPHQGEGNMESAHPDARHPDELKCLRRLSGTAPIDDFEAAIESVLAEAEPKQTVGAWQARTRGIILCLNRVLEHLLDSQYPLSERATSGAFGPFWSSWPSKIATHDRRAEWQLI